MSHQTKAHGFVPLKAKSISHMLLKYLSWYLKKIPSYDNTKGHIHVLKTMQIFEMQMCNENVTGKQR
jgi:hypothetical protein